MIAIRIDSEVVWIACGCRLECCDVLSDTMRSAFRTFELRLVDAEGETVAKVLVDKNCVNKRAHAALSSEAAMDESLSVYEKFQYQHTQESQATSVACNNTITRELTCNPNNAI